jgi:hypothetical protein
MKAQIVSRDPSSILVQIQIPLTGSMLGMEETILVATNAIGSIATNEALTHFDTDGKPIRIGDIKLTSKGRIAKEYQTPFGPVCVERHVYQTSDGGRTYCPLEVGARILTTSTPRFGKVVSHKYAEFGSGRVCEDLEMNHGRKIARSFVQSLSEAVGAIALAREESWTYETPIPPNAVDVVGIGVDGTCMLMCADGWREAMVGTISLYGVGERLQTTYIGASPEYGKELFYSKMESEIDRIRSHVPGAVFAGIADGAKGNWEFLKKHTDTQTVDFFHATEYLTKVADAVFPRKPKDRKTWMDDACHRLKHNKTGPKALKKEMEAFLNGQLSEEGRKKIECAHQYFSNQGHRMTYAENLEEGLPIGSGVTEAACKTMVKQRLCCSGMKWNDKGASIVLSLRCLSHSTGRWEQFWEKINRYGVPEVEWCTS